MTTKKTAGLDVQRQLRGSAKQVKAWELAAKRDGYDSRGFSRWVRDALDRAAAGEGGLSVPDDALEALATIRERYASLDPADDQIVSLALRFAGRQVSEGVDLAQLAALDPKAGG